MTHIEEIILQHKQDIKRDELYIKLYRINIMTAKCRIKKWEYYEKHNEPSKWERNQEAYLEKIWDKIMNEIEQC
jgi:hypothetical protein